MASLVFELLDRENNDAWKRIDIVVTPGISALQSAAAKIGAPLGHDFCAISLSDLLTPWEAIQQRLQAAAEGDFVISFYNPVSKKRDWQLDYARDVLLKYRPADTPVIIARQLGRPEENLRVIKLVDLKASEIDMLTLVMIGSSNSRCVQTHRPQPWVYTPRGYNKKAGVEL
jgi:cobalt-precorrin 5A hydrolase/precorrin-3B C17-methyltransferase